MSNLQPYYHFKLDFQKVDQHTGGKWLIMFDSGKFIFKGSLICGLEIYYDNIACQGQSYP